MRTGLALEKAQKKYKKIEEVKKLIKKGPIEISEKGKLTKRTIKEAK